MLIIKLNERYLIIDNERIQISKELCNWIVKECKTKVKYELA